LFFRMIRRIDVGGGASAMKGKARRKDNSKTFEKFCGGFVCHQGKIRRSTFPVLR